MLSPQQDQRMDRYHFMVHSSSQVHRNPLRFDHLASIQVNIFYIGFRRITRSKHPGRARRPSELLSVPLCRWAFCK